MRSLDSQSLNDVVYNKLIELKHFIEENITPENINYFDPILIQKATGFLDREFYYDRFSNINSVDSYKLNSMINYLKINNYEYAQIYKKLSINSDKYTAIIQVPEGFDGRNSFIDFKIDSFGESSDGDTSNLSTAPDTFNNYVMPVTLDGPKGIEFVCYPVRNKNNIKILTKDFLRTFVTARTEDYNVHLVVYGFAWRKK